MIGSRGLGKAAVLRVYAPFIALALVQALLVVAAPSVPRNAEDIAAGSPGNDIEGTFEGDGPVDGTGAPVDGAGPDGTGGPGGTQSTTPGQGPGQGPGTTTPGGPGAGDTGHCTKDGRQFGDLYHAPPCVPKWRGGDNGGATARGVTATEVRIVMVRRAGNAVADSILAGQGLGITNQEMEAQADAAEEFINSRFELYGRKAKLDVFFSTCRISPSDVPCFREEAKRLAKDYFAVIFLNATPPEFWEEVARQGTIAIGGWHFHESAYTAHRPFRYDGWMDGSASARMLATYYCKKLADKPATNTGPLIHATIGSRGQVPRKLGIITPDSSTRVPAAQQLRDLVNQCSGTDAELFTGSQDTTRANEGVTAVVQGLISEDVTTVVFLADPVGMSLITNEATRQGYFPEWLISGQESIDWDVFGRLQDPEQWQRAFGLGHGPPATPASEVDATKVWRATGRKGHPGQSVDIANLYWNGYNLAAHMIQMAGPKPTAAAVEQALVAKRYRRGGGGRTDVQLWAFGPGDYTSTSDVREIYWEPSATSRFDGKSGAYVGLNNNRRYEGPDFGSELSVPVR